MADVKTLGELLGSNATPIEVPDWQRNYAWRSTEVETFWTDLLSFDLEFEHLAPGKRKYFLGSIVLVGADGDPKLFLLDGQQRLATSTILLAAIRDHAKEKSWPLSKSIDRDFIRSEDEYGNEATVYRLTLNAYDRSFFRGYIQQGLRGPDAPESTVGSHVLITKAHALLLDRVRKMSASLTDQEAVGQLKRLVGVLTKSFSVVSVSSTDEDTAAEVFETLNDRGIGLSTPDLLRNLLMRRAPTKDDREKIVEDWREILEMEEDARVDQFLRHFWITRKGDVKKHSLYREIRETVVKEDRSEAAPFSGALRRSAGVYRDLAAGRSDDNDTERLLVGHTLLDSKVIMPALLAGWAWEVDHAKKRKLLKNLVAFFVRHRVVVGLENNEFEKVVFELARTLRSTGDFDAANAALLAAPPSDDVFERQFSTKVVTRRNTQRYLLIQLELDLTEGEKMVEKPDKVHVEHVYPQNPPSGVAWRHADHPKQVDRLGNLTLLAKRLNGSVSNTSFAQKRDDVEHGYPKSEFELTKALMTPPYDHAGAWTADLVDARQREMARRARSIWRLEP